MTGNASVYISISSRNIVVTCSFIHQVTGRSGGSFVRAARRGDAELHAPRFVTRGRAATTDRKVQHLIAHIVFGEGYRRRSSSIQASIMRSDRPGKLVIV